MSRNPESEANKRIQTALETEAIELDLSQLELREVPKSIAQLTNLQELYLYGNQLTSLPDAVAQLINLQKLDLYDNQLAGLPDIIVRLTSLQELNLENNQLTSLPDEIAQLNNLRDLNLLENQLESIPEKIGCLIRLKNLNLSVNKLINLPDSIRHLANLKELYLSRNKLLSLPDAVAQLTNLEILSLTHNQLTSLPDWIGKLTELKIIFLEDNQLVSLPNGMKQLSHLEYLYLHENHELNLPREILGQRSPSPERNISYSGVARKPSEILDYYFRTRQGEKRPLNEAKLIFVGYGNVGKTSLVDRLVHKTFDKDSPKTEGIQITQWPIKLNDSENVRLNVWDFGGQEIMHATHQFFLTQRSLYILVLNGRQGHEDADAEYWLNLIESFGDESPVLIVLNKIKAHPFDLNHRVLRQKFPNIVDFIETDCETSDGINTLRETIKRETDRLEHLRDAFPASWFGIKDRIATMPENFISFERYRDLCTYEGETNNKAQEQLSTYLHHLGIILSYKDDPRLRDTHVLNPQWVTKGIYTILNANTLAQNKGELNVCDFATILDPTDYPPDRHPFLFELMRKFELCFRFPEDEGRYLIPQLLDKQQPPEADDFEPAECLNFQYHYPSLPEGLLPRFIVRTHTLSTSLPRWRTGVILGFDGAIALIKADIQDKKVYISVSGSGDRRRRLLAIIRYDFEHIHSSFSFKPQEMIPVPGYPGILIPYQKLQVLENKAVKTLQEVVGDDVLDLNVIELLNGVDLEGTRQRKDIALRNSNALRVFCSYSHKDETLREELGTILKPIERQGLIDSWSDHKITPGQEFDAEIKKNLARADIILLLVSQDFMASDYIDRVEVKQAIEKHEANQARVIPIIVRDTNWKSTPFRKLKTLPQDGKYIKDNPAWPSRDTAWRNVSEGIEAVIRELQGERQR
jgi:internalin A